MRTWAGERGEAAVARSGRSQSAARLDGGDHRPTGIQLEDALERTNLQRALHRVERNGGAPGIDAMTTAQLRPYLRTNWPTIARALITGSYRPSAVRRVEIAKPGGGMRPLGIPTVLDRFLQQALLQVLTPIFEREFSPHSYGFRPRRSAHQAVRAARTHIQDGYGVVVDLDIASFFDRVNHVRRYLQAGVMIEGVKVRTEEGTPQGGPLSPLLAKILLDDLDRELARRGHRFVRYADDCNVYVRCSRAGQRVMVGVRRFLRARLKLQLSEKKSAVDRAWKRPFLGFAFHFGERIKVRLDRESLRRVKAVLRQYTRRNRSIAMAKRIAQLDRYLIGWLSYFALAETPSTSEELDKWLRRRLRACRWKEWRRGHTRKRNLQRLGVPEWAARQGWSHKGPWRMAHAGALQQAMGRSSGRNWACAVSLLSATRRSGTCGEPPDADSHVRWCERRARATGPPTRFAREALAALFS